MNTGVTSHPAVADCCLMTARLEFVGRPERPSDTIAKDLANEPPTSEKGFTSAKSQAIDTTCCVNNIDGRFSAVYQGTKEFPYIACLLTANARYIDTASE